MRVRQRRAGADRGPGRSTARYWLMDVDDPANAGPAADVALRDQRARPARRTGRSSSTRRGRTASAPAATSALLDLDDAARTRSSRRWATTRSGGRPRNSCPTASRSSPAAGASTGRYQLTLVPVDGTASDRAIGPVSHARTAAVATLVVSPDGTEVLATYHDDGNDDGVTWRIDVASGTGTELAWPAPAWPDLAADRRLSPTPPHRARRRTRSSVRAVPRVVTTGRRSHVRQESIRLGGTTACPAPRVARRTTRAVRDRFEPPVGWIVRSRRSNDAIAPLGDSILRRSARMDRWARMAAGRRRQPVGGQATAAAPYPLAIVSRSRPRAASASAASRSAFAAATSGGARISASMSGAEPSCSTGAAMYRAGELHARPARTPSPPRAPRPRSSRGR